MPSRRSTPNEPVIVTARLLLFDQTLERPDHRVPQSPQTARAATDEREATQPANPLGPKTRSDDAIVYRVFVGLSSELAFDDHEPRNLRDRLRPEGTRCLGDHNPDAAPLALRGVAAAEGTSS